MEVAAPPKATPRRRFSWKVAAVVGCLGCLGLPFVVAVAMVLLFGIGIEAGFLPDSRARAGSELPSSVVEELRELGIVDADEPVLFFYSGAMLSIAGDGNLFTDRRVISYQTLEGRLHVYEASWDEIEEIEFDDTDSWLEDSTITVQRKDGDWFLLIVANESRGDDAFYRELRDTWQRAVAENPG